MQNNDAFRYPRLRPSCLTPKAQLINTRAMLKLLAVFICLLPLPVVAARQTGASKSEAAPTAAKKGSETYSPSAAAKAQFMRESGYRNGRPGYVVAYRKPLACGGTADISNMEWLTTAEAKAKDKADRSKNCK